MIFDKNWKEKLESRVDINYNDLTKIQIKYNSKEETMEIKNIK